MSGAMNFWLKVPVAKYLVRDALLMRTQTLLNEMFKNAREAQSAEDAYKVLLPLLTDLVLPFQKQVDLLHHQRGQGDDWHHLISKEKLVLKKSLKLETLLDHQFAVKIVNVNKYFTPPEGFAVQGGIAFKLDNRHDFLLTYRKADVFLKEVVDLIFGSLYNLALFLNYKDQNRSLSEQVALIKKQLVQANQQAQEAEKILKKRLHEIDQIFQVSNELFAISDRENLINTALLTLVGQLGCDSTFALLEDERSGDFSRFYSKGFGIEQHRFQLKGDSPIVRYFKNGGDILYYPKLDLHGTHSELMPFFSESHAKMVAPLVVDGKLIGIIGCGEKLFGGDYDSIDQRIFRVLMNTVSLAFKNQFIYEQAAGESFIDKNTGIPNKKFFERKIEEEKSRAKRQKSNLAMMIIQPVEAERWFTGLEQNLKSSLERKIVNRLLPVVRTEDFLAYLDEATYVLVMAGVTDETIGIVEERMRKALEPFEVEKNIHPDQKLEFELQTVIYPDQEEEFEAVLGRFYKRPEKEKSADEEFFSDLDFNL